MLVKKEKPKNIKVSDVFTDNFVGELTYFITRCVITSIFVFLTAGTMLFSYIFSLSEGSSMAPNIPHNSAVVYRRIRATSKLKTNDIVIFESPYGDGTFFKRVIGHPGDIINIDDDDGLFVNGKKIRKDYSQGMTFRKTFELCEDYKVSDDSYYLLGDNRENSMDSRDFGGVEKDTIIGKAVLVIPVSKFIKKRYIKFYCVLLIPIGAGVFWVYSKKVKKQNKNKKKD